MPILAKYVVFVVQTVRYRRKVSTPRVKVEQTPETEQNLGVFRTKEGGGGKHKKQTPETEQNLGVFRTKEGGGGHKESEF